MCSCWILERITSSCQNSFYQSHRTTGLTKPNHIAAQYHVETTIAAPFRQPRLKTGKVPVAGPVPNAAKTRALMSGEIESPYLRVEVVP